MVIWPSVDRGGHFVEKQCLETETWVYITLRFLKPALHFTQIENCKIPSFFQSSALPYSVLLFKL